MICYASGILGINPDPWTLRELCWMVRAKSYDAWNHTASLLCQTANLHRGKDSSPKHLHKFHPFMPSPGGMSVDQLRAMRHMPGVRVVTITLPADSITDPP